MGGNVLLPDDVVSVIKYFYACNEGDEATNDLVLAIGAELLGVSRGRMLEMVRMRAK